MPNEFNEYTVIVRTMLYKYNVNKMEQMCTNICWICHTQHIGIGVAMDELTRRQEHGLNFINSSCCHFESEFALSSSAFWQFRTLVTMEQ